MVLDLSRDLYKISHPIVIQKLSLVAANKTTKLFKSYLSGGTQLVRIAG